MILGVLIIGLGLWLLWERHNHRLAYFVITSESMEPTLKIGDRVIMKKSESYQVGEIIVFSAPGEAERQLVKRIIGRGGDLVVMRGEEIQVTRPAPQDAAAARDVAAQDVPTAPPDANSKSWLLSEGEFFVAGDNRAVSRDSRQFGPIPLAAIEGSVRYRLVSRIWWAAVK